jgi:hypothetical protein
MGIEPMSHADFHEPTHSPAPGAACAAAHAALQRRLDGEAFNEPEEVRLHGATCAVCRSYEEAARKLQAGLKLLEPESPPADFAQKVMAHGIAAPARPSRRFWWRAGAVVALAASVLLAIYWIQDGHGQPVQPAPETIVQRQEAPQQPQRLDASLDEAGDAVAALTRKAAPPPLDLHWPSLQLPSDAPLQQLEPAVASIQSVGQGAVFSVSPITSSAKRAADLFWRELGAGDEQKPKVN